MSRKYGKRPRVPRYIWIVYDPEGKPRNTCLSKPADDIIAWPYVADHPNKSANCISCPEDYLAAKAAGYRVKQHELYRAILPA